MIRGECSTCGSGIRSAALRPIDLFLGSPRRGRRLGSVLDDTDALARRAAEGDARALEILLERNLPNLRAFVRARLGPELRAQESTSDIVQSTCREVLEQQERFQHPGSDGFRRWLFTTAARKVSDRLAEKRTLKRDAAPALRIGAVSGVSESRLLAAYARFSTPSHQAQVGDEVARIEGAMDRLSEEQREVLLMSHLVGMSRSEIAAELDKTEIAIRSILHRAMARLALELGEIGDEA